MTKNMSAEFQPYNDDQHPSMRRRVLTLPGRFGEPKTGTIGKLLVQKERNETLDAARMALEEIYLLVGAHPVNKTGRREIDETTQRIDFALAAGGKRAGEEMPMAKALVTTASILYQEKDGLQLLIEKAKKRNQKRKAHPHLYKMQRTAINVVTNIGHVFPKRLARV